MNNAEVVAAFVETLLHSPDLTMQAVQVRLSCTDYELKLLKSDPCRMHYDARDAQQQFPFQTGQGVKKLYDDDFHDH